MKIMKEKPFVAGNWKMNKTVKEAVELVNALRKESNNLDEVEISVFPPYTALSEVRRALEGSPIQLGAQNLFWEEKGAYTGEISALMLSDLGCKYVIIGHSERRENFAETDFTANKKIKAALRNRLIPILCVGESLEERKKEETTKKIENQIKVGLEGISKEELSRIIIAYEPIWAIGTGLTATPEQAQQVHYFIKEKLKEKYGNEARSYAIIYGGSVKPENTFSLLRERDIEGALVGGASLEAKSFVEIIKEAIRGYKDKK